MIKQKLKLLITLTLTTILSVSLFPKAAHALDTSECRDMFLKLHKKISNPSNGYFKNYGPLKVPYYSKETLLVEPNSIDYGHDTTSETFSYYIWLEAMYGSFTEDWSKFNAAWGSTEKFIIPNSKDQKGCQLGYDPSNASTFANDYNDITKYPTILRRDRIIEDPLANELKATYGTNQIYSTHNLLDVDNWHGFGNLGDENDTSRPSYINLFDRGPGESIYNTIPHPSFDLMKVGGKYGFLDLFTKGDNTPVELWAYKNAPLADANIIQATYFANQEAESQGRLSSVKSYKEKSSKLGDYLRYSLCDKFFQPIGIGGDNTPDYSGKHYLISDEYIWSGAGADNYGNFGSRYGGSTSNINSQNPLAAYILSNKKSGFTPKSPNAADDWTHSLERQLELYQWLQTYEGAVGGAVTNSYLTDEGSYSTYPRCTSTFYGMAFDTSINSQTTSFLEQVKSMKKLADYYLEAGDERAEKVLDKWAS